MFEALFKYPPEAFANGQLLLALPAWQIPVALLAIFAGVVLLLGYLQIRGRLQAVDLAAISALRALAIAVILFSLSRPQLEVVSTIPQPGVVGVLLDNSLSMRLGEDGEQVAELDDHLGTAGRIELVVILAVVDGCG